MNKEQLKKIAHGIGFISAFDQSGGSTPATLARSGMIRGAYHDDDDDEMFALMDEMRTRLVTNPGFGGDRILATSQFEDTVDRQIGGFEQARYVWTNKHVVPFLKVDKGLAHRAGGARRMNPQCPTSTHCLRARPARGACGQGAPWTSDRGGALRGRWCLRSARGRDRRPRAELHQDWDTMTTPSRRANGDAP